MEFFPTTLSGWVGLVLQLIAAISAAVAISVQYIRRPIEIEIERLKENQTNSLKTHGERLGTIETRQASDHTSINSFERQLDRTQLQLTSISEAHGRWEGKLEQLFARVEQGNSARAGEERDIIERLARIETRLDIFDDIQRLGRDLLRELKK